MKVKDSSGNVIPNTFRTAVGGLTVDNLNEYRRFLKEKEDSEKLIKVESELAEIKSLLLAMIYRT